MPMMVNQTSQFVHILITNRSHHYIIIILVTRKETNMERLYITLYALALAGVWIIAFFLIYFFVSLGKYIEYRISEGGAHEKKHHSN